MESLVHISFHSFLQRSEKCSRTGWTYVKRIGSRSNFFQSVYEIHGRVWSGMVLQNFEHAKIFELPSWPTIYETELQSTDDKMDVLQAEKSSMERTKDVRYSTFIPFTQRPNSAVLRTYCVFNLKSNIYIKSKQN